ncbi:MAG TPA: hypothetical protein PKV33_00010 [Methanothrix sp.]|nr:hypothetical protein [Methanothrix sp.]
MQKELVSIICILELLAIFMPAISAEESLNATANATLNQTLNATANVVANTTSNLTEALPSQDTTAAIAVDKAAQTAQNASSAAQNGIGNASSSSKVLRAGFEKTKPLNDLDVYGNKSTYNIPFSTSQGAPFEVNQRLGNVSQFTYNTQYKPIYNISQYSRNKPTYEIPASVSSKPTYSITNYPVIKAANSIP